MRAKSPQFIGGNMGRGFDKTSRPIAEKLLEDQSDPLKVEVRRHDVHSTHLPREEELAGQQGVLDRVGTRQQPKNVGDRDSAPAQVSRGGRSVGCEAPLHHRRGGQISRMNFTQFKLRMVARLLSVSFGLVAAAGFETNTQERGVAKAGALRPATDVHGDVS